MILHARTIACLAILALISQSGRLFAQSGSGASSGAAASSSRTGAGNQGSASSQGSGGPGAVGGGGVGNTGFGAGATGTGGLSGAGNESVEGAIGQANQNRPNGIEAPNRGPNGTPGRGAGIGSDQDLDRLRRDDQAINRSVRRPLLDRDEQELQQSRSAGGVRRDGERPSETNRNRATVDDQQNGDNAAGRSGRNDRALSDSAGDSDFEPRRQRRSTRSPASQVEKTKRVQSRGATASRDGIDLSRGTESSRESQSPGKSELLRRMRHPLPNLANEGSMFQRATTTAAPGPGIFTDNAGNRVGDGDLQDALARYSDRSLLRRRLGMEFSQDSDRLRLTRVLPGSWADRIGLEAGDRIIGFENKRVDNFTALATFASFQSQGRTTMRIERQNQRQALPVDLQSLTRRMQD